MPQYCLIKHRIENVTIDGADPDRNPDRIPVTGMVTFTPLLGKGDAVVITENGEKTTLTLSPIEARITNGELWHRGEPGVKLFAGGPDTNPERIRYRAKFENLIGGGRKVELKDVIFEAAPGGEMALSAVQPVPAQPYPGVSPTMESAITEITAVQSGAIDQVTSARDSAMVEVNALAADWVDRLVQAGGSIGGGLQPLGSVVETVTLDPPVIGGTKVLTLTGDVRIFLKMATPGDVMTIIVMQGPGAPHAVTWPGSISWQGGEPALSDVEGRADVITLLCVNGISWLGFVSGQDMVVPPREIRDTFNRPDSPALGGTDTGQVWVSSGWTISGSQARAIELGARAVVDTGEADRVEVSVRPPTGGGTSSVHFRMGVRESADGASFYRLVWTNLTNAQSYILRNDGTTQAMIGTYFSLGAVVGDKIALRCVVSDGVATLTVLRNGTVIHTVTDATPIPEGTYAGITNMVGSPTVIGSAVIDDFRVVYP